MNRPNSSKKDLTTEKQQLQEEWYKLVVKIISWADKDLYGQQTEKITPKEWSLYYKQSLKNGLTAGKDKVQIRLNGIKETITRNGGFS